MKRSLARIAVLVAVLATLGAVSASARPLGGICRPCQDIADRCWQSSASQYNACNLNCLQTFPIPGLPQGLCLAGCEATWIYRNAQCGASYLTCITVNAGCEGPNGSTPILVDLDRNHFRLGGLKDPVLFDLDADGVIEWTSWTRGDQRDAFLCLDRNGNGRIDDGSELFGERTPLMFQNMTAPNGYIALGEFDAPSLGGETDGVIDSNDAVYGKLCLWTDSNHNGVSEAGELTGLAVAGVHSIGIAHTASERVDRFGNLFWYFGTAEIEMDGQILTTTTSDVVFIRDED